MDIGSSWDSAASPELPDILQIALVLWGDLDETVSVVWPDVSEIHSFVLGQSGGNFKKRTDGVINEASSMCGLMRGGVTQSHPPDLR